MDTSNSKLRPRLTSKAEFFSKIESVCGKVLCPLIQRETELQIPSDTKGKNCNIKLSPEKYYTLNPEGIKDDFTAAKGSRITIMKTTESRRHFETNIEYYSKGLTFLIINYDS